MGNFSVVIPFFNGHKTIKRLLDSLPHNLPVIVVDDHSDSWLYTLDHIEGVKAIRPATKGYFTGAVNRGIEACNTDVLILNQDTFFTGDGWLDLLDEALNDYDLIGEGVTGNHPAWPTGYIHGTFMYISRRVIDTIGLMNEIDYPLWGSTCEYQLRACRAGFRALPLPTIPDFHHRDTRQQRFGDAINTALEREPGRKREFIRTPPEVSVIIPCYNYGRYLPDAISSLMAQTFQSFEVVIVDDASTDNSREIIEGLVDPWKGIKAVYLPQNRGTAGALNAGVEASYGRYISILSADDMMKPDRLENFYRLQLQNPHSFIYDDMVLFGSTAERLNGGKREGEELVLSLPPYDFEELLMKNGIHAGIFYPRQAWKETGGYPAVMGRGREDWAFNVALGLKGWCGVKCEVSGYLYRREGHNRTMNNTDPISRQKFMGQMMALYPDIYRGFRPMGCCGNKSTPKLNGGSGGVSSRMVAPVMLPGAEEGWELLEYIGSNWGTQTYYGPVSRKKYTFGKSETDKVKPVIKTDAYGEGKAKGLLDLEEDGHKTFRVYVRPAVEAPVVEIQEEILEPVAELVKVGATTYTTSLPFNPANYTVGALKRQLVNLKESELEVLLEAEQSGLNRKGAINAIEEVLNG